MTVIFGVNYSREKLLKKVGDVSQICGVSRRELTDGRARGVQIADFWTGTGLEFSVNLSRGMGLGALRYKGMPFSWTSATGEVAPCYYEPSGGGLDRSYAGGLLHMSGLRQVGAPCTDDGEDLGLHGRICNIPANNIYTDGFWEDDEYCIFAQGTLHEVSALGENLVMTRRVTARMGKNEIEIKDKIINAGHKASPLMILYHTNFGFPLIDAGSRLIIPVTEVRDAFTGKIAEVEKYGHYVGVADDAEQQIYFHKTIEKKGWSSFIVENPSLEIGLRVDYLKKNLPELVNWVDLRTGHNVVEVGPSNCKCFGREAERKAGTLQYLEPGESKEYELKFTILEGTKELKRNEEALMK
jgi:hypothetical protein